MTHWAEKYMTVPYKAFNRKPDFSGCNCWGLVYLVFQHELGIDLPSYGELSAKRIREVHKEVHSSKGVPPWQYRVEPGTEGLYDVAVFKGVVRGQEAETHVGIITKPGWCLHTTPESGVVHVPFRDSLQGKCQVNLMNKLTGIFRHEYLVAQ